MIYESFKVGQALREQRLKKDMTLEELAFEVNRSKYHINLIELGTRKMSIDLLFELMTVLKTDANSVLGVSSVNENGNKISIDERLSQLDAKHRKYYEDMFLYMLDSIPA